MGRGFRQAMTSRPAKVAITAVVIVAFAWRGYVLFFASTDPDHPPGIGLWLVVSGIYLLLRSTWWKQPHSEAGELPARQVEGIRPE